MNRKLWIWVVAVFAVFASVMTAVELGSERSFKKTILASRLEGYSDMISRTDEYERTASLFPDKIRVSVIRTDGSVLFDTYESADSMDNHLSRPEIAACLKGEDGCSIRKSETAGIDYIYFARAYDNVIVRTAMPFEVSQRRFMHPDWMLLITVALLFGVAVLIIRQLWMHADAQFRKDTDARLQTQKNRITGNLAHELRTPVTSIRGYLETLVDKPDMDAETRSLFLERAYLQSLRLSDLIRDISLITKMEEAPEMLPKEYLGMRKLSDSVLDELAAPLKDNDTKVENLIPEDLSVKGNQSLLYALFRNLVENSIRYGGSGITIRMESTVSDGYVHFVYMDNGKGVAEEHLPHLFERFYRIPEEGSHHAEGSGLGLSIVKNAVAFHGGTISASCVSPHGLCFHFSIPVI